MIGIVISQEEYEEYKRLKSKNTPKKKRKSPYLKYCPVCGYVVDNRVPPQSYCDNCGQRLNRYT